MLPSVNGTNARRTMSFTTIAKQNGRHGKQHEDANGHGRLEEPIDGQRNPKGEAQPSRAAGDAFRPNVLPDAGAQGIEQRLNGRREPGTFFVDRGVDMGNYFVTV